MKSANKVKMRTSIIVLFFIIVAAFCKYAYLLSDVMAVLAFFCKFEFSMIKYSVLWAGMATFWLSCLIVI